MTLVYALARSYPACSKLDLNLPNPTCPALPCPALPTQTLPGKILAGSVFTAPAVEETVEGPNELNESSLADLVVLQLLLHLVGDVDGRLVPVEDLVGGGIKWTGLRPEAVAEPPTHDQKI